MKQNLSLVRRIDNMSVETNDKNEAVDFMKEHIEQQNKINQETQALLKQLLEKTQPPPSKKRKTD